MEAEKKKTKKQSKSSEKKQSKSSENEQKVKTPEEVLKNMVIGEPAESPFGIIIPLEEAEMILTSSNFSIMESYPDLKSAEPTFTLRINLGDGDTPIFEKIQKKLASSAMKQKGQVEKLAQKLDKENEDPDIDFKNASKYEADSFKLIRDNGMVWGKLYHNRKTLEISAPFWRLIEKEGRPKKRPVKKPNALIGSELEGRICLNLKQIFMAKHKAITCVATEVLVTEERKPVSNFDEFSDEEEG